MCIVTAQTALLKNSHQKCVHEGDRDVKVLLCISSVPVIDKVIEGSSFDLFLHAAGGKINILTLGMRAILFYNIMIRLVFVMTRL